MIQALYIDLFCGAGGTSTGVERAVIGGEKCAKVIACVNHDPNAIKSHAANHPHTLHFTEDIRTLDLTQLVEHTKRQREKYPDAQLVLWASLECTNFSRAKGGQPRDADSRTLADHLPRYVEALDPSYIYIENVEEFMSWGDLDENGKPISRDEGRLYLRWVKNMCSYGYGFSHKMLNAADFGARTSRTRFFGIFAKHGLPIVFPEPTHCKGGRQDMFGTLKPWNAVRDVLDLQDEGKSIFERKKPLTERTLERILAGLIKFVAGGKDAFLVKWNSWSKSGKYIAPDIDSPCPVVSTQNRLGIAKVQFLSKQFSGDPSGKNISIDEPSGAITCKDHHALVGAEFLDVHYGNGYASGIDAPAPTLTCKDRLSLVTSQFLDAYYGKGHEHSVDQPAPVLRTVGHLALVSSQFMDMQYGNGTPADINEPSPTVTAVPKMRLISVESMQFLFNPQYQSSCSDLNKPCFVLIARMDKNPPYLISADKGEPAIIIYEDDTPAMRKIKEFMACYNITDIKMRMLNIPELKRIMGFGTDYTLVGTQTEQKKYIGNAVEVNMSKALCEALCRELSIVAKCA